MVSAKVTLTNPQGMHMRPAQLFVNTINAYPCDVTILHNGGTVNARSIMNLMAACIKCGACIKKCPQGAKYYDDAGYLYHKEELEAMYGTRRAANSFYL